MQNPISTPQLKKLHVLLGQLGLMSDKKELLLHFTSGRTASSKGLSFDEAKNLIGQLSDNDPCDKQRKAILSLAYKAGIIYGNTPEDYKMNDAKLNKFLREKGTVKNDLNKMKLDELIQVHRQFEAIVKNNRISKQNKQAKTAVDNLLSEMNITVK